MAILLVPCTTMLLTTYVNAQTIFLLRDPDYFGVSGDTLGRVSSSLVIAGIPSAIVSSFGAGYLFDIFGRRATLFVVFFIGAGLVSAIPYTSPNVYP